MKEIENAASEYAMSIHLAPYDNMDIKDAFVAGYEKAIQKVKEWMSDRDFDDYYLTSDVCGYSRICQVQLEEDLLKALNGGGC